ncbi:MAG: TIGR04255 family protein [Micrococcales bacterium]|nr:TIGR04255 family protein [Micrococcales bacterium]MCL2667578.1 TIGR04255 family protein [Micrococcales bacterium]
MSPYRHPPLVLALLEVRHPEAGVLTPGELNAIKQTLIQHVPLTRTDAVSEMVVEIVAGQPQAMAHTHPAHRFLSRDSRTQVTFQPTAITVETAAYQDWAWFSGIVRDVLTTRQDVAPVDGVDRVGLRYVDEIRIPPDVGQSDPPVWDAWMTPQLLAPRFDGLRCAQQQCAVQYELDGPGHTLTVRYGALEAPSQVPRTFSARAAAEVPTDHFFLVDTDAAWTVLVGDETPELDVDQVLDTADQLHAPSKKVFEAAISQLLRTEVLDRA